VILTSFRSDMHMDVQRSGVEQCSAIWRFELIEFLTLTEQQHAI